MQTLGPCRCWQASTSSFPVREPRSGDKLELVAETLGSTHVQDRRSQGCSRKCNNSSSSCSSSRTELPGLVQLCWMIAEAAEAACTRTTWHHTPQRWSRDFTCKRCSTALQYRRQLILVGGGVLRSPSTGFHGIWRRTTPNPRGR